MTNLAAAAGVVGASITITAISGRLDIGMVGNGAIGALVAITAPCGFVELWAAPIIGVVAGALVVRRACSRSTACSTTRSARLSAHGVAGVWGTLACGLFASPRIVDAPGVPGRAGLVYGGGFEQLGVQAVGVLSAFTLVFVARPT